MNHAFHPDALAEYAAAVRAYEESQPGLGARFIEHTEAAIAAVSSSPERWPILEQDIRRRLTRIFPFAILYTVEEDYVLIVAVMHCHRKPGYWHMRVGIPATK
jgi:hypothetical protein